MQETSETLRIGSVSFREPPLEHAHTQTIALRDSCCLGQAPNFTQQLALCPFFVCPFLICTSASQHFLLNLCWPWSWSRERTRCKGSPREGTAGDTELAFWGCFSLADESSQSWYVGHGGIVFAISKHKFDHDTVPFSHVHNVSVSQEWQREIALVEANKEKWGKKRLHRVYTVWDLTFRRPFASLENHLRRLGGFS